MYRLDSVLTYKDNIVGLRVERRKADTTKLYDVEIEKLQRIPLNLLTPYRRAELTDKDGLLVTQEELTNKYMKVTDVSDNVNAIASIQKSLLTSRDPEELMVMVRSLYTAILNYKDIGARIEKQYADETSPYHTNPSNWRKGAVLKTRKKFEWNEDHDFCERQYDGFGVIDDCPIFADWVKYAEGLCDLFSKKYSVTVEMTLEGMKYDVTLDITVTNNTVVKGNTYDNS